jgi:hypothetical protein
MIMGGPKNSFFHLKLIEKMSFYLNFRALKVSVPKTFIAFGTALMFKKNGNRILLQSSKELRDGFS